MTRQKSATLPDAGKLRSDGDLRQRMIRYGLGLVGWALIVLNSPFSWDVPNYAAF